MNKYLTLFVLVLCVPTTSSANFLSGLFNRFFGYNFHTIEPHQAYRSGALPSQELARTIMKNNIKTVINLRGSERNKRWWIKEHAITHKMGVRFYNIALPERTMPTRKAVEDLLDAFEQAPRPLLIHGSRGVNRTSLAAALYDFTQSNMTKIQAKRHFSDSFGHFSLINPSQKYFFDLLPQNADEIRTWLTTYDRYHYPAYNDISSPRMYPGTNFGVVEKDKLYRSAQLKPAELYQTIKTHRIKTVINLMGRQEKALWWHFEHATAQRAGAAVHDLKLFVDALPPRASLIRLLNLYDTAPKPILIHCRDGADRTGEAAALWRLHKHGVSIHDALKELSLAYKHFSFMHPAKAFFIRQWRGSKWAFTKYDPSLFARYQPPLSLSNKQSVVFK